jgi:hypothetical protein
MTAPYGKPGDARSRAEHHLSGRGKAMHLVIEPQEVNRGRSIFRCLRRASSWWSVTSVNLARLALAVTPCSPAMGRPKTTRTFASRSPDCSFHTGLHHPLFRHARRLYPRPTSIRSCKRVLGHKSINHHLIYRSWSAGGSFFDKTILGCGRTRT